MSILQVQNLHKSFGVQTILNHINFTLAEKEKVGLVGVNGSGKTTLLNCITGHLTPDSGSVFLDKTCRAGHLEQINTKFEQHTLWAYAMSGFTHLAQIREEITYLEQQMVQTADEVHTSLAQKYEHLLHQYEDENGYACESLARGILLGLGFHEDLFISPVKNLSGGQRTRLRLASLLASQPHLLILDEPTNNLDISAVEWLENYLLHYPGTVLMVSHDRRFLNRTVTRIIEIEGNHTTSYKGNYDDYLQQKEQNQLALEKAFQKQQAQISKTEAYIDRYRAGIKSKQAAGREKQLQRMERLTRTSQPQHIKPPKIKMDSLGGQQVLGIHLDYLAFAHVLFEDTSISLRQGEKVGLIGANGTGKSTLLKLITGQLHEDNFPPQHFSCELVLGSRIVPGYFSQEFELLNPDRTLLEEIYLDSELTLEEARSALGSILFSHDLAEKKIHQLSGGEKARIALLKMILSKANLLILDEPTNHLDLQSCAIIENMLLDYQGTILLVSHDRYLLDTLVQRIVSIEDKKLISYPGNYSYYVEKKARATSSPTTKTVGEKSVSEQFRQEVKSKQRQLQQLIKKIERLEQEMDTLHTEKKAIEQKMSDASIFSDYEQIDKLNTDYIEIKNKLEQVEENWLTLQDELSAYPY